MNYKLEDPDIGRWASLRGLFGTNLKLQKEVSNALLALLIDVHSHGMGISSISSAHDPSATNWSVLSFFAMAESPA